MSKGVKTNGKNNTRNILSIICLALTIFQILSGIAFIGITEVSKSSLTKYAGNEDKDQIYVTLTMMDLFGIQIIFISLCGIVIVKRFVKEQELDSNHSGAILSVWMCFSFLIILSGFVLYWTVYKSSPLLERSTELSLTRGIELYYAEPKWRLIWDDMQYKQQCCGVHSYKDWKVSAWVQQETTDNINDEEDNGKSENCDNFDSENSEPLSLTPYSCCKHDRGCFESLLPSRASNNWLELPVLNISVINTEGCFNYFSNMISYILRVYLILYVEVLLLQILISFLLQMLFIKAREYIKVSKEENENDFIQACKPSCWLCQRRNNCCKLKCLNKENLCTDSLNNMQNECDDDGEEENDENPEFSGLIVH